MMKMNAAVFVAMGDTSRVPIAEKVEQVIGEYIIDAVKVAKDKVDETLQYHANK